MTSPSVNHEPELLSVVRALVALSETDLPFADRYLDRAATLLEGVCSRERFHALENERVALARLTTAIQDAADRGRWQAMKIVAHQASSLQAGLSDTEEVLRVAGDVHRARTFRPTSAALALGGVVDLPWDAVEKARNAVVERLREMMRRDREWADFYRERAAGFARLRSVGAPSVPDDGQALDLTVARKHVAEAIERGAFVELEHLAEALSHEAATTAGPSGVALSVVAADLDTPFPAEAIARAVPLGLVMETLAADECSAAAAACRLRRHDGGSSVQAHVCPSDIRPVLCDNLEFLSQHIVVSSAGRRYVPSFGPEVLLVESFPETEPDGRTPLLDVLGLSRRRGLARSAIEDALSRQTAAVCERLGLDPFTYAVACIPFDAYVRLAPSRGWGRQSMWTHFDGYQVTNGLQLRALVGGDVRYGGCHDFCMVGQHYDGAQVTARFAVVRRSRLSGA